MAFGYFKSSGQFPLRRSRQPLFVSRLTDKGAQSNPKNDI
jgi:hypothetical protein